MQYALQKAVTALIDNNQKMQSNILLRKGRPLKSLSDQLKGKEGRFRQHLLGKRVDYSARSVIVVGPTLKLYECGIPIIMALRLFQPFLIIYLINRFKIASLLATQLIQQKHPIVINILKKFIETWPILLNRAPTLHRMNIQSFKMKLVQGKAILLHPLVCSSFNADFDGDQMGVHVPITQQARAEAWKLLWSINNSIGLASRQPLFLPTQDMVIGNFYLTRDSFPYYQNSIYSNLYCSNYEIYFWKNRILFTYSSFSLIDSLSLFLFFVNFIFFIMFFRRTFFSDRNKYILALLTVCPFPFSQLSVHFLFPFGKKIDRQGEDILRGWKQPRRTRRVFACENPRLKKDPPILFP
nr:RNA polymerase beta' subunit [Trentepohlia sp. YN1317]